MKHICYKNDLKVTGESDMRSYDFPLALLIFLWFSYDSSPDLFPIEPPIDPRRSLHILLSILHLRMTGSIFATSKDVGYYAFQGWRNAQKTESIRAQNTANKLSDVLCFLSSQCFFCCSVGFNSSQLQILTSGHIAILFGTFLEIPEM